MAKLAITLVTIALLSITGIAHADGHEGLQDQIIRLQQDKKLLLNRLNRAISYSKDNRKSLENELAMQKEKSAKERQTLLRRIDRAKAYSRANKGDLQGEMAMQKEKSAKERQTLLRRIDRAKAYSRAKSSNLESGLAMQKEKSGKERQTLLRRIDRAKAYSRASRGELESEMAMQKEKSAKERQTLLRRIDRTKAYSRARAKDLENQDSNWAVSLGATLDGAFGGAQGTTVSTNADDSVTIQVGNNGLFSSGGVALSPGGAQLLSTISRELASTYANITVVGHSDNIPVGSGSRFANNEELSYARASSTLSFLREQGISSDRLFAAGYGADRPIAGNDTPEGRQQNRRVDIILRK